MRRDPSMFHSRGERRVQETESQKNVPNDTLGSLFLNFLVPCREEVSVVYHRAVIILFSVICAGESGLSSNATDATLDPTHNSRHLALGRKAPPDGRSRHHHLLPVEFREVDPVSRIDHDLCDDRWLPCGPVPRADLNQAFRGKGLSQVEEGT